MVLTIVSVSWAGSAWAHPWDGPLNTFGGLQTFICGGNTTTTTTCTTGVHGTGGLLTGCTIVLPGFTGTVVSRLVTGPIAWRIVTCTYSSGSFSGISTAYFTALIPMGWQPPDAVPFVHECVATPTPASLAADWSCTMTHS